MPKTKKTFKYLFFLGFLLAALILLYVFTSRPPKVIELVFGEEVVSLNPYTFTTNNDQLLRNIYNPLVRLDSKMAVKPSLAVSYGRIDDFTWEFRLTPNAMFHDGSKLTTANITHTFEELKQITNSKSLTNSIEEIEILDDYQFQIKTKYQDPILLNKLSLIPIIPDYSLRELVENPIGTGPYIYDGKFENTHILKRNPEYFSRKPKYEEVRFTTIPDRDFRIQYTNMNPRVVMVSPFPSNLKTALQSDTFNFATYPNLSVNFFLFNMDTPILQDANFRRILTKSIRDADLVEFTEDSIKPTGQFISNGVFGFDSTLSLEKYDTKPLELAVKNQGYFGTKLKVALPQGLDAFQEFLDNYWFEANLRPEIDLIPYTELTTAETRENYDLIFLGWRSDYGDALQFFESFTIMNAEFNLGNYSNPKILELLEQIRVEFDPNKRLKLLKESMHEIVFNQPLGIPLFETEVVYALQDAFTYTPRADGYIDVDNLDYHYLPRFTVRDVKNFLNQEI